MKMLNPVNKKNNFLLLLNKQKFKIHNHKFLLHKQVLWGFNNRRYISEIFKIKTKFIKQQKIKNYKLKWNHHKQTLF